MNYEIITYETDEGKIPLKIWLDNLDVIEVAIIARRIDRFRKGNFGDCDSVGSGVYEARIHDGPGYRIYYSKIGNTIILLLCGGIKKTQSKDISKAQEYLENYKSKEKKRWQKNGMKFY